MLFDGDTWEEFDTHLRSTDPLKFVDTKPYQKRLDASIAATGMKDALIAAVRASYPQLSHRYYRLKARWLGTDRLPFWDRNAPLPGDDDRAVPWDEAQSTVLADWSTSNTVGWTPNATNAGYTITGQARSAGGRRGPRRRIPGWLRSLPPPASSRPQRPQGPALAPSTAPSFHSGR